MRQTYYSLIVVLIFLGTVAGAALAAQARWEDLVKAAEREGEVTVYATNSVGDLPVIWQAFQRKFPKIKLNAVPISTTSEIVTKIMAERRANQFLSTLCSEPPAQRTTVFIEGRFS